MLYDLTSTYFEGDVDAVPKAQRGYSRDHRPDCKQLVLALIVTPEGFPLTYEVFPGNRLDRTTLEHILDTIEKKFGKARRLWVFDRGIVSEDNLELLRQRGAHYLVGTPKSQLKAYEQKLLDGDWQKISDRSAGATHSRGRRSLCALPQRRAGAEGTRHAPALVAPLDRRPAESAPPRAGGAVETTRVDPAHDRAACKNAIPRRGAGCSGS